MTTTTDTMTNGEAVATNHNGYADRLAEMARRCAEQRQTPEYAAYIAANLDTLTEAREV